MVLDAGIVTNIFMDCLFKSQSEMQSTNPIAIAEGITCTVGFHPERLAKHEDEILSLLAELPDAFNEETGGGWSFLRACEDRQGHQWGEHKQMEQLFQLGIGIGRVKCLLPRDMWAMMPGGMPYYVITKERIHETHGSSKEA